MSQPFLFVGVGGSGGDTLLHLYNELSTRLRRVGINEMPSGWQFLHVDSRTTQETHENLAIPESGNYTYVGLVQRDVTYRTIARALGNSEQTKSAMAGWRPDPAKVNVAIEEGAGQYRSIGRVLAITRLKHIKEELTTVVKRVRHADAAASLEPVTTKLTGKPPVMAKDTAPVAVVISSLAGGTGSGMFQDVCDLLRGHHYSWAADSTAILYAPDVFAGLADDVRQGVQANALATVTELLAGYWNSEPTIDPMHQLAGVTVGNQLPRSGPARAFLVGSTNQKVNFRTQQEVFAAVGRTVAAWATSPSIQKQFSSYVQSNWQQAATRPDPLGLAGNDVAMPFSALGYASVGLGRGLFREYVGQCLARAAAERIMKGTPGVSVDMDAVVRQRKQHFMRQAGLGGPDFNHPVEDVYEALRPPRDEVLQTQCREVRAAAGSNPEQVSEWRGTLIALIGERRDAFVRQQQQLLDATSEAWITAVQGRIRETTVKSIVSDGLPVTLRLLHETIRVLTDEAIPHLENGAQQDEQEAGTYRERVGQGLGEDPPKNLFRRRRLFPPENERVIAGLEWGIESAFGRSVDCVVRKRAAKLLKNLVRELLKPLVAELGQGLDALRRDVESAVDGKPSVVEQWPPSPGFRVPKSLEPVRTQFLVDDIDDYPEKFLELLQTAVSASLKGDAVTAAVRKIIGDGSGDLPSLLEQTATWRPEVMREWVADATEQRAVYRIEVAAADLLARCEEWATSAPGLGSYIEQSLADALGGDQPDAEQRARIDRFAAQFEQALLASAPLVEMDPSYGSLQAGEGTIGNRPLISQIPLRKGTDAYNKALQLLVKRAGFDEDKAADQFNVAGSGEIEFTTFLGAPCHPVAFLSLTDPIRSDWQQKSENAGQRAGFARWRRARPLTRVVPLPAPMRREMVRGWFVAHLLDRIEITGHGTKVRITAPGNELSFPAPLLGEPVMVGDPFDALAAVLESFPLVFIESLAEDSEPVKAYRALAEFGRVTDLVRENTQSGGNIATQIEKLLGKAVQRLPVELPLAPDRAWELRADVHEVLEDLCREVGGEVL
ncbi:hypothetical protein ALI144C_02185 [Actinosynnema sp. ALI-1.44]|uniref:tubulin-like doman-containing protein n=1 Tax=Actinosynnema sp. ALI-1.44 TaxID=1933779 RepID=UPI00097BDD26|nr:tubulin-like doman-containing protein [Actinosynnema sp. ALI-1.44]ONI90786.1 hypothetical protein ALI144C_02185 [Actinosynnema sp. ALI-1.44]